MNDLDEKCEGLEKMLSSSQCINFFKRKLKILKIYYVDGALPHSVQEKSARDINSSPRKMTCVNAIAFGAIGATLEYGGLAYLLKQVGIETSNESFIPVQLSQFLDISYQNALRLYVVYNLGQSAARVSYSVKTGKGIMSFSPMGFALNIFYHSYKGVRWGYKKVKNGIKNND